MAKLYLLRRQQRFRNISSILWRKELLIKKNAINSQKLCVHQSGMISWEDSEISHEKG
jgi:hypothetical protein